MKCDLKGKSSTYIKRHVHMHSRIIQSILISIIEAYPQQINTNFSPCINCTYLKKTYVTFVANYYV